MALIRPTKNMDKRIYRSLTSDGGITWSDPEETKILNPGAPVCGVSLGGDESIIGYNDSDDGRKNFSLAYRRNSAAEWQKIDHEFESSPQRPRLSYCSMIRDGSGRIHVVFSDRYKGEIFYASFTRAWLDGRMP